MNIQRRQFIQTAFLLIFPCLLVLLFVISTQTPGIINFIDTVWYLNRARLIWQGVFTDLFVYTLAYPTVVGAINLVLHDVILSAMLTNAALLWSTLVGVYILGIWLYSRRRIAGLAVLLVLLNGSMPGVLTLLWATLPFMAVGVWSVIVCMLVVRRPGMGTALLLGAMLALAIYTRVEAITYFIFIPIAAGAVYRQRHDRRLALQIFITAGVTAAILCIPFALNFTYINRHIDRTISENVTGIFTLLNRTPIEWFVIWRRVTDTLTAMISHWPSAAWLVGIAGVLWAWPRFRQAQLICTAFIGLNVLYAYVLAIWPMQLQIVFFIPFAALILAATFDQLLQRGRWSKYLAQLLLISILAHGVFSFVTSATTMPVMNYRTSNALETGRALDDWIQKQGWSRTHIYTFCSSIVAFSHSDLQLIYRLQFTTGWDRPQQLFPRMREEGSLLLLCDEPVYYPDWRPLLTQEVPPGLHEVGRFQNYIFYSPNGLS